MCTPSCRFPPCKTSRRLVVPSVSPKHPLFAPTSTGGRAPASANLTYHDLRASHRPPILFALCSRNFDTTELDASATNAHSLDAGRRRLRTRRNHAWRPPPPPRRAVLCVAVARRLIARPPSRTSPILASRASSVLTDGPPPPANTHFCVRTGWEL
jgi:hypothetical protein